jgi:hypothetical protein
MTRSAGAFHAQESSPLDLRSEKYPPASKVKNHLYPTESRDNPDALAIKFNEGVFFECSAQTGWQMGINEKSHARTRWWLFSLRD